MATNPFREHEERIATGGLAGWLVRNADPRSDPNGGNVRRLPVAPARDRAPGRGPATTGGSTEWLGRWAVLAMFGLTMALAGVFLVLWLTGEPMTPQPAADEPATAQPAPASLPPSATSPPTKVNVAPPPEVPTSRAVGTDQPAKASTEPRQPLPAPPVPPTERPVETAGLKLTPAEIQALSSRGDALLTAGDLAAARPLLERAALAGDATAALRLGQSYDPGTLAGTGLREVAGNLGLAIFWYRRSAELGNGTAGFLARKLETAARAEWRAISARPPTWRP